jgi:choline-glycine betaine transporter
MINIILVSTGIIIMLFSVYLVIRLISLISDNALKKEWNFLFFLIGFFLIGYILYLYLLLSSNDDLMHTKILISSIFFLGALFVLVVLLITINLVKALNEDRKELNNKNKELSSLTEDLQSNNTKLEETRKSLDSKNSELNSLLEEFYTLRTTLVGEKDKGKMRKENALIKEKLERAKKRSK